MANKGEGTPEAARVKPVAHSITKNAVALFLITPMNANLSNNVNRRKKCTPKILL